MFNVLIADVASRLNLDSRDRHHDKGSDTRIRDDETPTLNSVSLHLKQRKLVTSLCAIHTVVVAVYR